MIDQVEIIGIRKKICTLIENQVKDGEQSKGLDEALACGQFINVLHLNQRGLHGTSAAIRVLAAYNGNYNNELRQLINYLSSRKEIEKSLLSDSNLEVDEKNVIKIGEILYALSFVKQGSIDTKDIIKNLATKLIDKIKSKESWGYFIDSDGQPDILPTAFAYLGLRSNHFNDLKNTEVFLVKKINDSIDNKSIDNPSIFSSIIAALYILSKYNIPLNYRNILSELWKSPFCTMDYNVEQNLEYPYNHQHYYIRIPWQLYFLALTSKHSPNIFTKKLCRNRILDLKAMANDRGFKYNQSGSELSSRTNAILFDVLEDIQKDSRKNIITHFYLIVNDFSWTVESKWFRYILKAVIFLCISYSIIKWISSQDTKIEELAPEFVGYIVSIILIFFSKK